MGIGIPIINLKQFDNRFLFYIWESIHQKGSASLVNQALGCDSLKMGALNKCIKSMCS